MIRILATLLGLGALAVAVTGFAARYLPIAGHPTLILAAAAPYLSVAALAAMLLFVVARRWVLALLAVALTVALMWVYVPRFLPGPSEQTDAVDVRVLTSNLGMGEADPRQLVALAGAGADVVAVQELTQEAADGLSAAGMDTVFPHRVIVPAPGATGIGIWSRHPIVHSGRIDGYALPMVGTRIRVPGVRVDATVLSVHLAAPWPMPIEDWKSDYATFPDTLREMGVAAGAGAVIVAGDFNATYEMAPFRRLLDGGYSDAGNESGAGLARSYPAGGIGLPLIGIDHILIKNCAAATARTVVVPGADHRGLLATLRVPVDMTAS